MANTRITGKPISYTRLAIVTPSATPSVTGGSADCIPVIEPKLTKEVKLIDYKIVQDTRYSQLKTYSMLTVKLTHKTPFILPQIVTADGSSGAAMLTRYKAAFLDRLLIPAGMVYSAITPTTTSSTATSGYVLNENWQSGYTPTNLFLQELYDTEMVTEALCNYKLTFSTQNGCTLDHEWMGLDGGITTGSDLDAMMALPAIVDTLPVFEYTDFQLGVSAAAASGDAYPDYYLACSEFTFDFGNKVQFYDDCNGHAGVSGMYIGNELSGQKFSFNVMAPNKHGSTISATTFPYWDYFEDGSLLKFKMRLYGHKDAAGYDSGVDITGVFQLTDVPDKTEANDLRRLKLGGTTYKNGIEPAFSIRPFYTSNV